MTSGDPSATSIASLEELSRQRPLDDVLLDLETQLGELRRDATELVNAVATERSAAEEWERRAMLTVHEGRDDLARTALRRHQEHSEAAETLEAELHLLEQMCDSVEKTVARIRAKPPSA